MSDTRTDSTYGTTSGRAAGSGAAGAFYPAAARTVSAHGDRPGFPQGTGAPKHNSRTGCAICHVMARSRRLCLARN